ncbi:MAG: hypothetical protein GY874_14075 [Desulfobacteraceae bacterium]|nr:hypothetical protein [Desulfobacteraceae bacterium]
MFKNAYLLALVLFVMCFACVTNAVADEGALASESEAYCKSTATGSPTSPATIKSKVDAACGLLTSEAGAAFSKFKGNGSDFIFEGTYIWIHTLEGAKMLMHPIKHKMQGKNLMGLKDKKGKRFFVTMNNVVKEKGSGWVEYYWPQPGGGVTRKISYVKGCTMADGTRVVIGCGMYGATKTTTAGLEIR